MAVTKGNFDGCVSTSFQKSRFQDGTKMGKDFS